MTRHARLLPVAIGCLTLLGGCATAREDTTPNPQTEGTTALEEPPPDAAILTTKTRKPAEPDPTLPDAAAAAPPQAIYPGVVVDRQHGHVDLRGRVIGRAVEWLELLACRPGTLEHEAIVTLDADARHIQLALILLGLEPGRPAGTRTVDDQIVFVPPRGPAVELFFVLDDQPHTEVPANRWIVDQDAGQVMPDNRWLFVGSRSIDHAGETWFLAEQNGTLVSLVNFGDELIGRDTRQSDDGGNVFWTANTPQIPAEGTRITLRIRPAKALGPAEGPAEAAADSPGESQEP